MNISLAPHAAAGAPGAHGKSGKGGDPLADFMAMLTQLGITVDEDGTATATPPAIPGAQDIAAKLLAKLGKKSGDAAPEGKPGDILPEPTPSEKGKKQDDPVTTLADLLAQIDPAATKDTASPKATETIAPDIATLIAAVRVLVSDQPKPAASDDDRPADQAAKAAPVAAAAAPSIAALLARGSRVGTGEAQKPVAPGTVQSAFSRLEALVTDKPDAASASGEASNANNAAAPDTSVASQAKVKEATDPSNEQTPADEKSAKIERMPEQKSAATKLGELLARLTASVKPGAGQPHAAADTHTATNAVRPHADPQIAALTQAIQNATRDDQPTSGATDSSSGTPVISGIAAPSAPAATQRADALPTDVAQANPAEELVRHHLDLAKDLQWLDTLARDIARAAQSDNPLRFQLNPEHLGSLKVELVNGANGTSVKLTADTEAARAILTDAQPRLVAEARAQGLRISEAHVDLSGHGGGGQRHMAEAPVMIRTANGAVLAEVEQDKPGASGERYA